MTRSSKKSSDWHWLVGCVAVLTALLSEVATGNDGGAAQLGPHTEGEFATAPAAAPTQAQKRFPLSQIPAQIALDRVAPARLNTETAAQPGKPGVPFKIGFSRDLLSLKNRAQTLAQFTWQSLPSGQIAALSVSSPDALGVRLGLLIENIPATALLRFYAQETDQVFEISGRTMMESIARNLAAGDPSDEARTYWSPLIDGPEITIEIELPGGVSPDEVLFSIPRLSHLFVSPLNTRAWQEKIGQSGSCNLDSTCYSATWGNESLATAKMAFNSGGSSYLCTGTLLNDNDASTVVPYFLSANHCISTQSEASSLQTYWFYRASSCNSASLSSSTKTLVGGAALLYANSLTDTSFMRLNSTPPAGAWYAAWTASLAPLNTAVTSIHNPSGDLQKISFATITGYLKCPSTPGSSSYSCSSATSSSADHLKLVWNQGITEGGSSGSGLWLTSGSSHYLIGQLHGGSSYCSAPTAPDNYGRFDVAYNAALYQWLGPTSTTAYAMSVSKSGSGTGTNTAKNAIGAFAAASSSGYTKIANNGADLPGSALLGSGTSDWACTRDNTTGLVWEVKTTDGGLRDMNKSYTNYDDPTQGQKWNGSGVDKPTQAEINATSNSVGFANAVNSSSLCGSAGWRMPSIYELLGLVNLSYLPKVDPVFFPNTPSLNFWTGSPNASYSFSAWRMSFYDGGGDTGGSRIDSNRVRLVRGGYALSVSATGYGSGTITGNAINCTSMAGVTSGTCSANLASGSAVTLSAASAPGSTFTSWSGCDSTLGATCTVTMNAGKNVIAEFTSSSHYTKIANNGADLAVSAVLGSGATQWACTRDNTTGLVWEVKTTDGGLRDMYKYYSNYDSSYGTQVQIDAANNSIGYANAVNFSKLCGSASWRMPSKDELLGLANVLQNIFYSPMIDPTFFPNTLTFSPSTHTSFYWSASPVAQGSYYTAWSVSFYNGSAQNYSTRDNRSYVRLVRGGPLLSVSAYDPGSGTLASSPSGINCTSRAGGTSGTCSVNLGFGSEVTLSAAPAPGSTFTSWSGCDSTLGTTCTVTMNASKNVIAAFAVYSNYTKIANNGADLPASALLGSGATQWACTRDNTTGLVWEVKTTDSGLRNWQTTYTNYDSSYGAQAQISATNNSIGFVNAVNSIGLCGAAGWKMPNKNELMGLWNFSYNPMINPIFFPNTKLSSFFWSASSIASDLMVAWAVADDSDIFNAVDRSNYYAVRLVHGGQGSFAPTITSFVVGSRRATIHFSPPSNTGGSPIALYTATCTASGQTARLATGTVSPLTVINLTGGVTYQCTLTSTNSGGSSSGASGAVSVPVKKSSITPILMLLLD
jgi:Protein of unknown function (DUF1566)/Divergent InlB B-repeat domain